MPKLSIREFAKELDVSHNTVRNVMKALEDELSIVIGYSQGKGKPTLLNSDEQRLIRERVNVPTKPNSQVSIVPYVPTSIEKDYLDSPVLPVTYETTNVEVYTGQLSNKFSSDLDTIQKNTTALDNALLLKLQNEGQLLGHQMFEAKYGTAFSTLNGLEQMAAKKQGLVKETA